MGKKKPQAYNGKLGLQQRVLPSYRIPFFQTLAARIDGGLSLFAGDPRPSEAINTASSLDSVDLTKADNKHLLGGQFYLLKQNNLIEWLEKAEPDTLIVEANPRYISTMQAVEWMHSRSRKVLGWGLGAPHLSGPLSGFREKRRRQFLSKLDGVISYSEKGAEEYKELGIPAEKVFVAHNAAVAPPETPPSPKPTKKNGALSILFIGRLQLRKKLDNLFSACAQLDDKPEVVIVGDGPDRRQFEMTASRIYPKAVFVGMKYGDELKKYYEDADLFVLPGTGGLAVQEAMANEMPVVVAKGDGTQDDLVSPKNGWLIPPDDVPALTSTLREALSDLPRLRKMGAESYRITKEEINIETMADKFINAINIVNGQDK